MKSTHRAGEIGKKSLRSLLIAYIMQKLKKKKNIFYHQKVITSVVILFKNSFKKGDIFLFLNDTMKNNLYCKISKFFGKNKLCPMRVYEKNKKNNDK